MSIYLNHLFTLSVNYIRTSTHTSICCHLPFITKSICQNPANILRKEANIFSPGDWSKQNINLESEIHLSLSPQIWSCHISYSGCSERHLIPTTFKQLHCKIRAFYRHVAKRQEQETYFTSVGSLTAYVCMLQYLGNTRVQSMSLQPNKQNNA